MFRTDVRAHYASINHDLLLGQLRELIDDPIALRNFQRVGAKITQSSTKRA